MNLALKGEREEITPTRHPRTELCIPCDTCTNGWTEMLIVRYRVCCERPELMHQIPSILYLVK